LLEKLEAWSETRQILDSIGFADHVLNGEFRDDELRPFLRRLREGGLELELEVGATQHCA
jgi:hypothetical protein